MSSITKKKVERLVRLRNKSHFNNNLQFALDCATAGIVVGDLGNATKGEEDGVYFWDLPIGKLTETHGRMAFEPK